MVGKSEPTTPAQEASKTEGSSELGQHTYDSGNVDDLTEVPGPLEHIVDASLPSGTGPDKDTEVLESSEIAETEHQEQDVTAFEPHSEEEKPEGDSPTDDLLSAPSLELLKEATPTPQSFEGQDSQLPFGYSLRELQILLPLDKDEAVCTVAAHGAHLYLGSTKSQIFHLYLFEDAEDYILISQLIVGTGLRTPIAKILPLEDAEICLILCNKILYTYLLPELSPCSVGKLKDVEDVLMLSQVQNSKVKSKLDKIMAFTTTRIRLIQVSKDSVKLLKDIRYLGSLMGLSSAAGTLKNYSNICFVANATNYDVVDIQQTRRIPLSEFNPTNAQFSDNKHLISPYMIPFKAQDKDGGPEEYLLVICSDSSSSMALFVNSEGDVIRGTLIWPLEGYPTGGLAVNWPHVIGLFYNEADKVTRFCISSLVTLEVNYVADASRLFPSHISSENFRLQTVSSGVSVFDKELLDILQLQSCVTKKEVSSLKQYKKAEVALVGDSSMFLLDKMSPLAEELAELRKNMKISNPEDLSKFCSKLELLLQNAEQLWPIYVTSLLLAGQFQEVKQLFGNHVEGPRKLDPRLLLLFVRGPLDSDSEFWKEFAVPKFILELLELKSEHDDSEEFFMWVIEEVFKQREHYSGEINANFRMYMYTETNRDSAALIELIDSEKNLWVAQNKENDELLEYFQGKQFYLVLLYVYLLKQKEGNNFQQWEKLIIELGLELLSGVKELRSSDVELQKHDKSFNLTEIVFFQLHQRIDDESYFAKHLLELLKLQPETGLSLLQRNKGGKFLSCIKSILSELSKLVTSDHQFSSLKIEYSEQAFVSALDEGRDYLEHGHDLGVELINHINGNHFDDEIENLDILFRTYQVENDLQDNSWPKLTWIEFLHIHRRNNECKELALTYLKLYEVRVILSLNKYDASFEFKRERPVTKYLSNILQAERSIPFLLEIRDFSTADWVVKQGSYPFPRTTIYSKSSLAKITLQVSVPSDIRLKNVKIILEFYFSLENESEKHVAIGHVINSIGRDLYTTAELLESIPDSFPLWCIEKFVSQELRDMKQAQADSALKKGFSRLDAKFTRVLLKEFEKTHSDLLNQ